MAFEFQMRNTQIENINKNTENTILIFAKSSSITGFNVRSRIRAKIKIILDLFRKF